jgi:4'-phosphopantetheinyl transferase
MKNEKDFVDIWHGDILFDEAHQSGYWPILSADEQNKAKTFKYPELQKKYIYTRATLRKLLTTYVDIQPPAIKIKTGPYGKPFLDTGSVYFNLSHTGKKLVIAISNNGNIGIDLEQYKHRKNLSGLAQKCFSDEELAFWDSLPEDKQVETFCSALSVSPLCSRSNISQ